MTATMTPLLLITADPSQPLAHLALRYARAYLANTLPEAVADKTGSPLSDADKHIETNTSQSTTPSLKLFFYADAAQIANRLRWQSADQIDLTKEWQLLAQQYQLPLPVCVSTALSRGVSDADNSARHQLAGDNLAEGFQLVGLSELALMMQDNCRLIQF
ncbi:sulfurtransferase complex subunit TusD [Psychrobacter sp. F1192]|uniref:Sulfurtransferase complex subunit TusD n=1 Tax=Psychrobacter coccoides TaxID=2818440 RepID=A0ABS3NPU2_9GAMM|nr:sulfurtransferase complex subunit TusD [Psychrobacter coccoides]MBO1531090.1 sulfurtransferase complex subunit TusD [Psychrobacter coccoides]